MEYVPGMKKIQNTRKLAQATGISWVWIDMCCTDPEEPWIETEVGLMYSYYEKAGFATCVWMTSKERSQRQE